MPPGGTYFYRGMEGWNDGEPKTKSLRFFSKRRGTINKIKMYKSINMH